MQGSGLFIALIAGFGRLTGGWLADWFGMPKAPSFMRIFRYTRDPRKQVWPR